MKTRDAIVTAVLVLTVAAAARAEEYSAKIVGELKPEEVAKLEAQRCPQPKEFASVFSYGYAGDLMPKEEAKFEDLLKIVKDQGFNTIHTSYTPQRLALCKKHGIKLMIDFLDLENHHVYKLTEKCQEVCAAVKGDETVWGYNIWNDMMNKVGDGRRRDINNVRLWDPTHPAYAGCYRNYDMKKVPNADVYGYYDFHWSRGIGHQFGNSSWFSGWSKEHNAIYYTWLASTAGEIGDQNVNRSLWSANTGIAYGLKGILWFVASPAFVNKDTGEIGNAAADIKKIHAELMPLKSELMKIGMPKATYGTKVTKDMTDKPVEGEQTAGGLPPVPADCPVQVAKGELILGVFDYPDAGGAVFVANYNADAAQDVELTIPAGGVQVFDRASGAFKDAAGTPVKLALGPGRGELLKFKK